MRNPLSYSPGDVVDDNDGTNWLETATQSLWFTVPICFYGLYGLIEANEKSRLVLLAAILLVPLGVAWIGSLFGSFQALWRREKIQISQPGKAVLLNSYLHDWVIALMIGWFYIGVLLMGVRLVAVQLLECGDNLRAYFSDMTLLEDDFNLLLFVPLVGVVAVLLTMGRGNRGSVVQVVAFAVPSFMTFTAALAIVIYLIEPLAVPAGG